MAEPQDSATVVFEDLSAGFQTQYHPGVQEQWQRMGHQTNRWFKPTKRRLTGKDMEVTTEHRIQAGARVNLNVLANMPTPRSYSLDTYTVSIDETAADNDLHRVAVAIRVTHPDIKRAQNNPHEKAKLVQKLRREALGDVDEVLATGAWLTAAGALGTITGDPVQNDDFYFDAATAHTTQTSVRAKLTGSIGRFHDGMIVSVFTSTSTSTGATVVTNAAALTVLDVNVADNSIGLSGAADLSAIATTDHIVRSGERGHAIISMGQWFGGETTIYGKNRATAGNRYLIPTRTRVGATAGPLQLTWLNDMAIAMGYTQRDAGDFVAITTPEIMNDFIELVDDKSVIQVDAKDRTNPFAEYGFSGTVFVHPVLGRIALQADPIADPSKIRFIRPMDWERIWGTSQNFEWLPGELGGIWYRMSSDTPGTDGKNLIYQADGYVTAADICLYPRWQGEIANVSQ